METHTHTDDATVYSLLSRPYEPLTLARSMTLFPTALGLSVHTAVVPSDAYLANLMTGRRTFQAILRDGFGADFKNFLNYSLGKVETMPATRQRLLKAVGGDVGLLEMLAQGARDDAVSSQLAKLARSFEGLLYQVILVMATQARKCPHCQADMISASEQWWHQRPCDLGASEGRFIDRILFCVMAVHLLPMAFRGQWADRHVVAAKLADLCNPQWHIFKNWLDLVRPGYRAKDLTALAVRAGMDGPSPDSRLQRCARGEMLTVETIEAVTARLKEPSEIKLLGMQSRALALAVDFLVAADRSETPVDWATAQACVGSRICRLFCDLELSLTAPAGIEVIAS